MKEKILKYKSSFILLGIFIIFTILVKFIDVSAIGPNGSSVGFSSINGAFSNLVGFNNTLYKLSDIFGYLSFLFVALYGLIGLSELIKRKNLFKVDAEILILGGFFLIVLGLYFLFTHYSINYRPVIVDGELEFSFPSSHTMLAFCTCGSAIIMNKLFYSKRKLFRVSTYCSCVLFPIILLTRLFSGIHWLTDIVGGIIISLLLLSILRTSLLFVKKR